MLYMPVRIHTTHIDALAWVCSHSASAAAQGPLGSPRTGAPTRRHAGCIAFIAFIDLIACQHVPTSSLQSRLFNQSCIVALMITASPTSSL
jgi:hypothetical protein